MFAEEDMSSYSEVLFWKQYMNGGGVSITHGTPAYIFTGGNNGMLKSFVDCFVMKDGLPYYAAGDEYKGDKTIMDVKENRDLRLQMFVLGEKDLLPSSSTEEPALKEFKQPNIISLEAQTSDNTGYRIRKCLTYNNKQIISGQSQSTTGCIIFRGVEAYLNYLEAYYELHGNLQGNCDTYWKALRSRANVDTDYQNTINNTIMEKEKNDWGSYSAGAQVNATLYNIRRERRIELAAEGHRMNDLKRWRALDQVQNVHIQGCNFWEGISQLYTNPQPEDAASTLAKMTLIEYGTTEETANVSSRNDQYAEGKYLLPYRKNKANIGFNGLNWNTAKYLYPISNREFRLTTTVAGSGDFDTSSIYQNPGWTKNDGTLPVGD